MMTKLDPQYLIDKRTFSWFCNNIFREKLVRLPKDAHPVLVLEQMAAVSPAQAKAGLKMALNDFIEDTIPWSQELVLAVDQGLASEGLPTLSALRFRQGKRVRAVLKRSQIRDESEYHLMTGIAIDQSLELAPDMRAKIDELLEAYEQTIKRAR